MIFCARVDVALSVGKNHILTPNECFLLNLNCYCVEGEDFDKLASGIKELQVCREQLSLSTAWIDSYSKKTIKQPWYRDAFPIIGVGVGSFLMGCIIISVLSKN